MGCSSRNSRCKILHQNVISLLNLRNTNDKRKSLECSQAAGLEPTGSGSSSRGVADTGFSLGAWCAQGSCRPTAPIAATGGGIESPELPMRGNMNSEGVDYGKELSN